MDQKEHVIPSIDELNRSLEAADRSNLELVFDVDLDEFTALFYGPGRESYVHPVNDMMAYLLDIETDEVIGVVFSRFTQEVIPRVPEMRDLVPDAMFIKGDLVGSIDRFFEGDPSLGGRISETVGAVGEHWESRSDIQSVRNVVKGIRGFA